MNSTFDYLSVPEVAAVLGVTDGRVLQLLDAHELLGHRLGQRYWAVARTEVDRYVAESQRRETERSGPGRPRKCAPRPG